MTELTPEQRTEILERHLHDHGHVDPEDVDAAVAAVESADGDRPSPALGARVVARAWVDAVLQGPTARGSGGHDQRVQPADGARSPCSKTPRRCTT